MTSTLSDNPLLAKPWPTPFDLPPFDSVRPEHFRPAFERALAAHADEIAAIAAGTAPATFANTMAALERAGETLSRVSAVFWNLASAHTNDDIQAIEREISPKLAAHWAAIGMNEALYARVAAVWDARDALDPEQTRLTERQVKGFRRSGVGLPEAEKARLKAIVERLSTLGTRFSQNVLADEKAYAKLLGAGDLDGLPDFLVAAMARAAGDRGHEGAYAVTLSRSIIEPFLTFSTRRDLREETFKAWIARGANGGESDNRGIIAEMVSLRADRAKLLGYPTFAHFKLDDTMAKTPEAVRELLEAVWTPALAKAASERADLQALARAEGANIEIAPWDWRFYSEKVRRAKFDLDEAELKPYLVLDQVIAAAFDTAEKLFGIKAVERRDLPVWHPDVRAWEIVDGTGAQIGLFYGDYFARTSKRSGAWMSGFRSQERMDGPVTPVILNVMNFGKPADGAPALLSVDDARTLFHEFGHALHGLLSNVTYPSLSGTAVARDFVELPSQLYEHWFLRPEVLSRFARHAETGEPIPAALVDKVIAARTFNQGFATVEFTSSALVDLEAHLLDGGDGFDADAFEAEVLAKIGMPKEIVMRHRSPHFSHVFSGDGYSAGYYSYMWSEVLDADAFDAFTETGDVFDAETAGRLRRFVYSAGGSRDPAELYTAFRGRMPTIDALLEKRGLAA
jgi:peptidyl-dipeptidase Dcp